MRSASSVSEHSNFVQDSVLNDLAVCATMFYQPAPFGLRHIARNVVRYLGEKILSGYKARYPIDLEKARWYAIYYASSLVLWLTLRYASIPGLMRLDAPLGPWSHPDALSLYLSYIAEETEIQLRLPPRRTVA